MAHILSELSIRNRRYYSDNDKFKWEGLYNLPTSVFPKKLLDKLTNTATLKLYLDYMNLFFDEHVYRFKDRHVSESLREQLNINTKMMLPSDVTNFDVAYEEHDLGIIPLKYFKDDFNAEFKEKKESVRSRLGAHITWRVLNKPSVVNTTRAWYREEVMPNQVNFQYTRREHPEFMTLPREEGLTIPGTRLPVRDNF